MKIHTSFRIRIRIAFFFYLLFLLLSSPVNIYADEPALSWNTFMGSTGNEYARAAVDGSGYVYVAGHSGTTWGTPINQHAGNMDTFVAKLDSNGLLLWHTFVGSPGYDAAYNMAVDSSGNVYVTGQSRATWGSPVNGYTGGGDVYAAKLDSNGSLLWNTFMGSTVEDWADSITVDSSGNVYLAGGSNNTWGTPINQHAGNMDTFAAKLDSSGSRLWNTFMGSTITDAAYNIAVDSSGNVYVAGYSDATWGTPVNAHAGSRDAFSAKLYSNGYLIWHTFMGSTMLDYVRGLAVDGSGNVYVAGRSDATWGSPVNAYAGSDAFSAKLNSNGLLLWNTFMGSTAEDHSNSLAVDGSGYVYVAGGSSATWGTPIDPHMGGDDAFIAKFNNSGVRQWNTFMGSTSNDEALSLAIDSTGNLYMAGLSDATWGTPINPHMGGNDAFVVKLYVSSQDTFPDQSTGCFIGTLRY